MENNKSNLTWLERAKKSDEKFSLVTAQENPLEPPPIFVPDYLYIAETPNRPAFGVFSKKFIKAGSFIETAYAFPLAWRQKYQSEPNIYRYAQWATLCKCKKCEEDGPQAYIGTGFSSIYNSSESASEANASLFLDPAKKACIVSAIKDINPNEEILIWFGQRYYDVWCKAAIR
jgi:hypothetical protein